MNTSFMLNISKQQTNILLYIQIYTDSDIDDCQLEPCSPNGICTDGVNSFECTCSSGFNGSRCELGMDFVAQYAL